MKKITWIVIILILAATILFAVYYDSIKILWLPDGSPAARPLN